MSENVILTNLKDFFEQKTGLEAPINIPANEIFLTPDVCNCFGCTEHCKSCWTRNVSKDSLLCEIKEDFSTIMSKFRISVQNNKGEDYFEDCFGRRID